MRINITVEGWNRYRSLFSDKRTVSQDMAHFGTFLGSQMFLFTAPTIWLYKTFKLFQAAKADHLSQRPG